MPTWYYVCLALGAIASFTVITANVLVFYSKYKKWRMKWKQKTPPRKKTIMLPPRKQH